MSYSDVGGLGDQIRQIREVSRRASSREIQSCACVDLSQCLASGPFGYGNPLMRGASATIGQVIELPLINPDLFIRVGIKPPKGVLLYGPVSVGCVADGFLSGVCVPGIAASSLSCASRSRGRAASNPLGKRWLT